jgi:geranylgeranyl diphosphate synthase type II
MDFENKWAETAQQINRYLQEALPRLTSGRAQQLGLKNVSGLTRLYESMSYSTNSGGKRFRPVLCLWSYETLGHDPIVALPFAAAIEMIHCYSLIHDDLPCMDNDDLRRGKPSNHKAFDEATALLAGTTLLTEAIGLVATTYEPAKSKSLVEALCRASGFVGMCGGQAIDIFKSDKLTTHDLDTLHSLKTGAMIAIAAEGAAILAQAPSEKSEALKKYAELLGLAFQVADDVLDYDPENIEPASYPAVVGIEETKKYLNELTLKATDQLSIFGDKASALKTLALYNQNRKS